MLSARVVGLSRYPVKSMLGERLEEAELDAGGIHGDRVYAVVDASDGSVASAKRWGELLVCRAAYVSPPVAGGAPSVVEITLPSGDSVRSDDPGVHAALSAALGRSARLVSDGQARFHDLTSVHLLTTDTLEALRAVEPAGDFDPRRFRPNVVVDAQTGGYVENDWVGRTVRAGSLELEVVMLTGRCAMTTLAQTDLPAEPVHLRAVNRHNRHVVPPYGVKGCAGVYATVVRPGRVKIGDPAVIEQRSQGEP
jgi:uncharacterized protein YcbX